MTGIFLVYQFVLVPLTALLGPLLGKNLSFIEAQYNPALNFTVVKFSNIGGKTLYNITVISEFGEINEFPLEVKTGQGFQVALNGQVSKATVQYATEPNGTKKEEDFEWGW